MNSCEKCAKKMHRPVTTAAVGAEQAPAGQAITPPLLRVSV